MRIPRVTIDTMLAVIALAQKKNLEQAGKELGLSASAVHKRIQAANQLFGTRLFIATNDGFELTQVGRVLYAHATLPVEQALLAEETTMAAVELHASHLLVGHSTYLPSRLLAIIHHVDLISTLGIRLEHKPGLTLALAQDVVKGTDHEGDSFCLCLAHGLCDLRAAFPVLQHQVSEFMNERHKLFCFGLPRKDADTAQDRNALTKGA